MSAKAWVGRIHTVGIINHCFALCKESGDGKGHGNTVIAKAFKLSTFEWFPSLDFHTVFELLNFSAHGAEIFAYRGDAVAFLNA